MRRTLPHSLHPIYPRFRLPTRLEKSVEIAETWGGSLTGDVLTIRFATSICMKTPRKSGVSHIVSHAAQTVILLYP